ncbi:MNIO family bufferin maturase [Labrys sp. 22185]|uniref:MNIO family bufferin maturase n=1 Tax=Labrys sp. 22185 TaxID=3453888 RepID=UPI003F859141
MTHPASTTLPLRAGAGLKPEHVETILATRPDIGFFEVHAENYMGAGGPPHAQLGAICENYALSLHGVGLSIGAARPLDKEHLARLKALEQRYRPASFSEHLAWSSHEEVFLNDLLPVPYTPETLRRVCDHIDEVQETLGQRMLLENPSTYLLFEESTIEETDFLAEIAQRTGCGLLLDINNVFVSATNHATSPETYLDRFPLGLVGEIHLAGHAETVDDAGAPLLIDAHDRPVADPVWVLYERVIAQAGRLPTLIEWDNDVPNWPVLAREAALAEAAMARVMRARAA